MDDLWYKWTASRPKLANDPERHLLRQAQVKSDSTHFDASRMGKACAIEREVALSNSFLLKVPFAASMKRTIEKNSAFSDLVH